MTLKYCTNIPIHKIGLLFNFNHLGTNPTKWSNTLRQQSTNCLSVFNHFVGLALKELRFLAVIYEFYVSKYLNEFEGWLR